MTNAHNISAIAITPSQLPSALAHTLPFSSVMIWGNVGLGKSQIVRESIPEIFPAIAKDIAKDRGVVIRATKHVDIPVDQIQIWERRVNDYDLLDFGGLPYNDDGIQRRAVPDIWPNVGGTEPVYGVLFLDEFPQAERAKQTVIQRLFDEGRVGSYVLPGHPKSDPECKLGLVLIILAGNRQRDKANSHGLGTQTGNRLAHFTLEPSVQDWLDWAAENDVDPTVMSFIRQMPEYLHKIDPSQFATASLLIRRATKDNFGHIVTYLSRLSGGDDVGWSSPEIMVFVVEAIRRRINVAETVTYRDWSLKWADIRS